jgi:hypothetical protein
MRPSGRKSKSIGFSSGGLEQGDLGGGDRVEAVADDRLDQAIVADPAQALVVEVHDVEAAVGPRRAAETRNRSVSVGGSPSRLKPYSPVPTSRHA